MSGERATPGRSRAVVRRRQTPAGPDGRHAAPVPLVMRRLGRAIASLDLPAIEKLAEDNAATAFHTLVSTMLSAQTRDPVTHEASLRLFGAAPTPEAMARLSERQIARLVYPVSFYRVKARHVRETCRQILDRFDGRTPDTMDDLLTLPGVGRKTANLVLIVAHQRPDHICVDTHVHRIANRLGWVRTRTPDQTERALYTAAPRRYWSAINLHLVTWGQNVCRPVYPLCPACVLADICPKIGVVRQGSVRDAPRTSTRVKPSASGAS